VEQIKFKQGEFQNFIATRSFALGAFDITVAKDSEVSFDGSTVEYAGATYNFPQLRGAIKANWLVLADAYEEGNPEYGKPVSANIKVRPATDDDGEAKPVESVTTDMDEQVVMSTAEHASSTREQNKTAHGKVHDAIIEKQDGVAVRALKTPAKSKDSLTAESAGSAVRAAENVQIDPGEGISEEEALDRMSPEDRAVYLEKKQSLRSQYVDSDASDKNKPTSVGKVKTAKTTEKEGMKLTQKVGGGVAVADLSGSDGKPQKSTLVEEGITFQNTGGPKKTLAEPHPRAKKTKAALKGTEDARVQIARSICAEFPDSYDFTATPKKKMARLQADFENRPDVIKAVFAAESDDFKAKLVKEFPEVFQG